MRAALYARVSTHDQQTLGMQVEAMSAYIKNRGWDAAKQVEDVGSGAKERPGRESLLKAARRREVDVDRGLAARPLGPVGGRPDGDAPRADRAGRRLRLADRGAGPDHPDGPGDGRHAGDLRGVRAGDLARAGPGRDRPGPEGGPTPRPAADGVAEGRRGAPAQGRAGEPLGDRAAAGDGSPRSAPTRSTPTGRPGLTSTTTSSRTTSSTATARSWSAAAGPATASASCRNHVHGVPVRIGYGAQNEDCEVRDNVVDGGSNRDREVPRPSPTSRQRPHPRPT